MDPDPFGDFALLGSDIRCYIFTRMSPLTLKRMAKCSKTILLFIKQIVLPTIHCNLHKSIGPRTTSCGKISNLYVRIIQVCHLCSVDWQKQKLYNREDYNTAHNIYVPGLSSIPFGQSAPMQPSGGIFKQEGFQFSNICYYHFSKWGAYEIPNMVFVSTYNPRIDEFFLDIGDWTTPPSPPPPIIECECCHLTNL